MGALESAAMSVTPPDQVYARTTVTTAGGEALDITDIVRGAWITLQGETLGSWFRVVGQPKEAAAPTLDETARSVLTGSVPAVAAGGCMWVPADGEKPYDCRNFSPEHKIWLVHKSSGTTGVLRFYRSSGPG